MGHRRQSSFIFCFGRGTSQEMMEKIEQTEKIQKIKEIIHRCLKENGRMKLAIDGMAA